MALSLDALFSNLSGTQRLVALILVICLSAILIAFVVGGWKTGIPVGMLVLALVWLTSPIWKPSESGRTRIALSSIAVVSSVAAMVAGKSPEAKPAVTAVLIHLGLAQKTAEQLLPLDRVTSGMVLAFVLSAIFIVNWLARDRSAMQKHPKPLDQDFPEQTYQQQLRRYSDVLAGRLATLDDETKWDDFFFAPLEAEVEVTSGRQYRKKIVDLTSALKTDHTSKIMLVLGDPGAGKSIALRKLAKDLLKEVGSTGRLPVYVNLKEWEPGRTWTEDAPPAKEELREFILRTLSAQSFFADQFLESYFDKMLDRGRFFFLLDSFDEIPSVLDVSEASWLVQRLSTLISEFFASQDHGRGVVASRFYRRPKFNRTESATFEIRPFSDMRIHDALMRSGKLREETVDRLFTARAELVPIARNPFSAALIRLYAESHDGALPANQLEMFEAYIESRLTASSGEITKYGLNKALLLAGATDISWCMFQAPEIGLEAPVSRLSQLLPQIDVLSITSVLRYSGLARLSLPHDSRFSFVHRRLNEYFVARRLLNDPTSVSLQSIPSDSRYRDALALYCEVGQAEHVTAIADFCWSEIAKAGKSIPGTVTADQLRSVHCLRFLRDAFRTRPDRLAFVMDLARYIEDRIDASGDLLSAKLSLEATGLLGESLAEPILVRALETDNPWLGETALHACRHRKRIGQELEGRLYRYLRRLGIQDFLRRQKEITFSLSLSDAFRGLRRYCVFRAIDNRLLVLAVLVALLVAPFEALMTSLFLLFTEAPAISGAVQTKVGRGYPFFLMRLQVGVLLLIKLGQTNQHAHRHYRIAATWWDVLEPLGWTHGTAALCVLALYALVGAALIPWLDITISIARWRWPAISRKRFLTLSATLGIGGLLLYGLKRLMDRFDRYLLYPILGALGLCAAFMLYQSALVLVRITRDRKRLSKAQQFTIISRSSIEIDLRGFETRWYRRRYVEWLRDSQLQPGDPWPNGRPNSGDEASILLAQLDERWLGLEG